MNRLEITPEEPQQPTRFQVEGLDGSAIALDPDSRYLIIFDPETGLAAETAQRIRVSLEDMGIRATLLQGGGVRVFELHE